MSTGEYTNLRCQVEISVEPVDDASFVRNREERYVILLVGPTGSGKSRFIETLSGGSLGGISKDQLQGMTQQVQLYRVRGCQKNAKTIFLVDTPGLIDSDLSEMRVFCMISQWMTNVNLSGFQCLLYFDRITDPRLSGSRLNGMEMVQKALLRHTSGETLPHFHPTLVHLTTMWDTVPTQRLKRFEEHFLALRSANGPWKEFAVAPNPSPKFARFRNHQKSALKIIDGERLYPFHIPLEARQPPTTTSYFPVSLPVIMNVFWPKINTPFGLHALRNTLKRIEDTKKHMVFVDEEMSCAEEEGDLELHRLLISRRDELRRRLGEFTDDSASFMQSQKLGGIKKTRSEGERGAGEHAPSTSTAIPAEMYNMAQRLHSQRDLHSEQSGLRRGTVQHTSQHVLSPVRFDLPDQNSPELESPIASLQRFVKSVRQGLNCLVPAASIIHATHSHRSSLLISTPDSSFQASDSPSSARNFDSSRPESWTIRREPQMSPSMPPTPTTPYSGLVNSETRSGFFEKPVQKKPGVSKTFIKKFLGNFSRLFIPSNRK